MSGIRREPGIFGTIAKCSTTICLHIILIRFYGKIHAMSLIVVSFEFLLIAKKYFMKMALNLLKLLYFLMPNASFHQVVPVF